MTKIPKILCAVSLLLISSLSAEVIDFGVKGTTYEVLEGDLLKELKQKARDLNQTQIQENMRTQIKNSLQSNHSIAKCSMDYNTTKEDFVEAPFDVVLPGGVVAMKKGEKVYIPSGVPDVDVCIIDGADEDSIASQLEYMRSLYPNCHIVIDNFPVDRLESEYGVEKAYLLSESFYKRFGAECLPARILMHGKEISHHYSAWPREEE